jgi:Icc-related predicted phosphoesterase
MSENTVDVICTLGDLEQSELFELEAVTTIPKFGVYGNHDSGMYFEPLGITNLHLRTVSFGGLTFGGFEGCVRYKNVPYAKMYTQEQALELLRDFPRVDVMIVHCPPYGVNDEPETVAHQGFRALRMYVEEKKPKYLLHGHTYPTLDTLVTRLAETEIIYVYQDKLVELTPDGHG